jgi:hypothetical protein
MEVAMIEHREPAKNEITRRAFALHLVRGCDQGRDVEDWVRAEKELSGESVVEGISLYKAFPSPAAICLSVIMRTDLGMRGFAVSTATLAMTALLNAFLALLSFSFLRIQLSFHRTLSSLDCAILDKTQTIQSPG